jgi:endonuclease/exonuclease/phosphatase (EEP) superfamily protein YafD
MGLIQQQRQLLLLPHLLTCTGAACLALQPRVCLRQACQLVLLVLPVLLPTSGHISSTQLCCSQACRFLVRLLLLQVRTAVRSALRLLVLLLQRQQQLAVMQSGRRMQRQLCRHQV